MRKIEKMMGRHKDGSWIEISNGFGDIRGDEFVEIVYTERLSKNEIKNIYPDLYEKHFAI